MIPPRRALGPLFAVPCLAAAACSGAPSPAAGDAASLLARSPSSSGVLAYATDISADGRVWIAAELGTDFELVIRDVDGDGASERLRVRLGSHAYDIAAVAIGPASSYGWIASADATVRAVDLETGETAATWRLEAPATAVAIGPGGRYVATGSARGALCLRRAEDGALLQCVAAHEGPISDLDFGAENLALASASEAGGAALWNVPSLAESARFAGDPATAVALCDAGAPALAVARARRGHAGAPGARFDKTARITVRSAGAKTTLAGHRGPIAGLAWLPGCRQLASGSWDRTIRLWDPRGGELARAGPSGHLVSDVAAGGGVIAAAAWGHPGGGPGSWLLDLR